MAGLTNAQKKEWAKLLTTKEGFTQKEAAAKVGTSTVTMNKWYKEGNWEQLKRSMLVTRQEQLSNFYEQIDELNSKIKSRKKGERYADSKEADALMKLTASIDRLENDASISDVIEVSQRMLNHVRKYNPNKAIDLVNVFDDYIKSLLK